MTSEPYRQYTKGAALREFGQEPDDLLDGIISSETTIVYGASGIGKGRLLAEVIASGLNGEPFADRKWNRPVERVAVIGTDAGAAREYAKWTHRAGAGIEHDENLTIWQVDHALSEQHWRGVTGAIAGYEPSLIIVDSTTEVITGGVNDDLSVREFWRNTAALRRLAPFVMVHHVAKPGPESRGQHGSSPLGSSLWTNYSRNKVRVHPGGVGVVRMSAIPRHSGPWSADFREEVETGQLRYTSSESALTKRTKRERDRDDRNGVNLEIADWIVANCQGKNGTQAGRAVFEAFPDAGKDAEAVRQNIARKRDYGALVERSGATWSRTNS